jgi:hypothetical protein
MDADIYMLAGKYGFKALHTRLIEIMREEYIFLHGHFEKYVQQQSVVSQPAPVVSQEAPVVSQEAHAPKTVVRRKKNVKKAIDPVPQNDIVLLSTPDNTVEVKDVIVNLPENTKFRDPKEVREFQKAGEEAKRKENEAAGIQVFQILTKENLKKWIEDEGRTYAWVAREKAGCADTQVAATAQMMGITSKISKKRGMIISGK